jgi:serralysin
MALHRLVGHGLPPSELPWAETAQWSVQSIAKHKIKLLNADGTFTVLHGAGFALDEDGNPTGGRVLSAERVGADGRVLEKLTGVNVSLTSVHTAFDTGGFADAFLSGHDVIVGTDNTGFFTADSFQEIFYSGAGNDIVIGGGGADLYIDGPGSDLYIGGRTSPNIDFVYDAIDYSSSPDAVRVKLTGGIGSFGSHVTHVGSSDVDTLVNFETFVGSPGDDTFVVEHSFRNKEGTGRNWINGGAGDDVIHGNGETLLYFFGGGETDAVYVDLALGISRSLNGAPEDDLANVGFDRFSGVNAVVGTTFNDRLVGSNSERAEVFDGGQGEDYIDGGGGGHDRYQIETPPFAIIVDLSGPVGTARLVLPDGSFETDTLVNIEEVSATEFDDDITLSDVDNVAIGENGNDTIRGLAGNDTLIGDQGHGFFGTTAGDDVLIGGLGKDMLTGNGGHDAFRFESILESGTRGATRDVITDFKRGDDLIDLAAIDANSVLAGEQAFVFLGDHAFTGQAGELHYVREDRPGRSQDATIVEGDVDGDHVADFQIELNGLFRLSEHDFLL